jgi:hypothetical protein
LSRECVSLEITCVTTYFGWCLRWLGGCHRRNSFPHLGTAWSVIAIIALSASLFLGCVFCGFQFCSDFDRGIRLLVVMTEPSFAISIDTVGWTEWADKEFEEVDICLSWCRRGGSLCSTLRRGSERRDSVCFVTQTESPGWMADCAGAG